MGMAITPDFWTPILQQQISCWGLAESYFDVGQHVYQEITTDGDLCIYEKINTLRAVSLFMTVLKIMSYVLVFLPLIMLAIKFYYRQQPREWVIIPSHVRTTTQAVRNTKELDTHKPTSHLSKMVASVQDYMHQWLTPSDCARLSLSSKDMFRKIFNSTIWKQLRNRQPVPINPDKVSISENYVMLALPTEQPMDVVRLQTALSYHYFLEKDQVKRMIFIAKTLTGRTCAAIATALEQWIEHYSTIPDSCFIAFPPSQEGISVVTMIPPRFFSAGASKLKTVQITNANLGRLSKDIGKLKCLINLSLIGNKLKNLPDEIGELTSLWMLLLNDNQLTDLPTTFEHLKGLGWLDLAKNRFSHVPESVMRLPKMQRLTLSHNILTDLPETIDQLSELTQLEIDGNKFDKPLPNTLMNLAGRLNNLKISRQHVKWLPITMQSMSFVEAVD